MNAHLTLDRAALRTLRSALDAVDVTVRHDHGVWVSVDGPFQQWLFVGRRGRMAIDLLGDQSRRSSAALPVPPAALRHDPCEQIEAVDLELDEAGATVRYAAVTMTFAIGPLRADAIPPDITYVEECMAVTTVDGLRELLGIHLAAGTHTVREQDPLVPLHLVDGALATAIEPAIDRESISLQVLVTHQVGAGSVELRHTSAKALVDVLDLFEGEVAVAFGRVGEGPTAAPAFSVAGDAGRCLFHAAQPLRDRWRQKVERVLHMSNLRVQRQEGVLWVWRQRDVEVTLELQAGRPDLAIVSCVVAERAAPSPELLAELNALNRSVHAVRFVWADDEVHAAGVVPGSSFDLIPWLGREAVSAAEQYGPLLSMLGAGGGLR